MFSLYWQGDINREPIHGRAPFPCRREREWSLSHRRLRAEPRPVMQAECAYSQLIANEILRPFSRWENWSRLSQLGRPKSGSGCQTFGTSQRLRMSTDLAVCSRNQFLSRVGMGQTTRLSKLKTGVQTVSVNQAALLLADDLIPVAQIELVTSHLGAPSAGGSEISLSHRRLRTEPRPVIIGERPRCCLRS